MSAVRFRYQATMGGPSRVYAFKELGEGEVESLLFDVNHMLPEGYEVDDVQIDITLRRKPKGKPSPSSTGDR